MKRINYQELEKYLLEETEDKEKQVLKFMTAALAMIDNQTEISKDQDLQISKVIDIVDTYNISILELHQEIERLDKFMCLLSLVILILLLGKVI